MISIWIRPFQEEIELESADCGMRVVQHRRFVRATQCDLASTMSIKLLVNIFHLGLEDVSAWEFECKNKYSRI